ncbi:hypothetical protein NUW58_g3566 [Xylaria curta]|uniref:Uncharacterized protein n=1 Tax=Xylaria curta TaxID=42375 RepID=A0ACC1PAF5_9PEZI|nr:hypothetical protein NUW58_g3566 [Xylaria curta]
MDHVPVAFDMLPASVRSGISALKFLRRSDSLSIVSTEEMVVTSHRENRISQVYKAADEPRTQVATRRNEQAEMASGVRWRYAEQGMNIHHIAHLEKEDAEFSRKSYIDGIAYMLMALPEELSDQESATIREALPPPVANMRLVGGRHDGAIGWEPPLRGRTILQRFVSNLVAMFVLILHLVLWYATIVVRVGVYYERKHNISQQIASRGCIIATAVGRHGVIISAKICAMKDGYVGKAMSNIAGWTVESIISGIQEGIGQGLIMIETKSRSD